jgi:uncharacterized protein (TIGR02646 family)
MIYVDRSRVPRPADLDGPASRGGLERADACTFYGNPANAEASYDFKAYKAPTVLKAIATLFQGKCAYCESSYRAVAPADIEHFRPKGGVAITGKGPKKPLLKRPGYYWLAAEWTNLYGSCIDCNRERTQQFPDADPAKVGKANKFPLRNERRRQLKPEDQPREAPLLLDPCSDKPEQHLEFLKEGVVRPATINGRASSWGKTSIEVYGLQRIGLVQERAERAKAILKEISLLRKAELALVENPKSQLIKEMVRDHIAQVKGFAEPDQPYAGMARQLIATFYKPISG